MFDVKTGNGPERLRAYFNDTVMTGYKTNQTRQIVAIGGEDKYIDRFATVLFKSCLMGQQHLSDIQHEKVDRLPV